MRIAALTIALLLSLSVLGQLHAARPTPGYRVLPGTGQKIDQVGDDFENQPDWKFIANLPKSSRNLDEEERGPLAQTNNGRWLEGPHRGTPDVMELVETPKFGIPGSRHALLMQTRYPGVPGQASGEPQQDDMMVKVKRQLGKPVPVEWSPNCVVRVYVPPFEQWENRSGASFGFRTDVWGKKKGKWRKEQYWPGIFINFRSSTDRQFASDSAYLMIRGDGHGRDIRGPEITPGWWTMGMSISPDGMCHFYARQGVDDLVEDDHLASYYCYGFRAEQMDLFFFNVVTMDNGRTWSTPWVIDDPTFYCSPPLADRSGRAMRR